MDTEGAEVFPWLTCNRAAADPAALFQRLLPLQRVLVVGDRGTGKSTLITRLADEAHARQCPCWVVTADPGNPAFGPPGALSLGQRADGHTWRIEAIAALCSLDAGRFRLPLVVATARLAKLAQGRPLLVDAPGVVRAMAGSELLMGLACAIDVRAVVVLAPPGAEPPLPQELRALGATVLIVPGLKPQRLHKQTRAKQRGEAWRGHLGRSTSQVKLPVSALPLLGAPPPREVPEAWLRRQVALLDTSHRTLALGEVCAWDGREGCITLPCSLDTTHVAALLVRDARRTEEGELSTAPAHTPADIGQDSLRQLHHPLPADMAPATPVPDTAWNAPVAVRVASAQAVLINGHFGDPLLHVRLRHRRRSFLFDLGEALRLPARIAHQVTDVFISHGHFDHIAGFMWLLRSRIGILGVCRIHGPPGLAAQIDAMVGSILWDRIEDKGPVFEVLEIHGKRLRGFQVRAGRPGLQQCSETASPAGTLLADPAFLVRAATLSHGTPCIAYAFEESEQLNVRKERLQAMGLSAGPWLSTLKSAIHRGAYDTLLSLPDGTQRPVGALADELIIARPGEKLVYATDFADTPENRAAIVALARGAHTLVCEATFCTEHIEQAAATKHLTAQACAEIATAAGVRQLLPFHFSRRYERCPEVLLRELSVRGLHLVLGSSRTRVFR